MSAIPFRKNENISSHLEDGRLVSSDGTTLYLTAAALKVWCPKEQTLVLARYQDIVGADIFFGDTMHDFFLQVRGRALLQSAGSRKETSSATVLLKLPGWSRGDVSEFLAAHSPIRTEEYREKLAEDRWYAKVIDAPGPRGEITIMLDRPVSSLYLLVDGRRYTKLDQIRREVPGVFSVRLPYGRFSIAVLTRGKAPFWARLPAIPSTAIIVHLTPEDDRALLRLHNIFPIPILRERRRKTEKNDADYP